MQGIMNRFNQLLGNFLLGGFFQITLIHLILFGKKYGHVGVDGVVEGMQGHDRRRVRVNAIGAASGEYLHAFGYTAYAYMWARMARVALDAAEDADGFYQAKLGTARFFFKRLLPRIHSLSESVRAGSEVLFELDA